jgi:hypothetical protein
MRVQILYFQNYKHGEEEKLWGPVWKHATKLWGPVWKHATKLPN